MNFHQKSTPNIIKNQVIKVQGRVRCYISVTRLSPEQEIPLHDCPQGSSLFVGQPSWDGEFIPLNKSFKADTVSNIKYSELRQLALVNTTYFYSATKDTTG